MKVLLLKDIPNVGKAGAMIKVTDGYATNFLFPKKLATLVTEQNEAMFKNRAQVLEQRKEAAAVTTSQLAEKIKAFKLTIKRKMHDDGKLYGSVSSGEIVELLAAQGVSIAKNQVIFDKSIKEKGSYEVTIKLSSRLQPVFQLKIVSE
jgi:large subunit ribosomal protein L9